MSDARSIIRDAIVGALAADFPGFTLATHAEAETKELLSRLAAAGWRLAGPDDVVIPRSALTPWTIGDAVFVYHVAPTFVDQGAA